MNKQYKQLKNGEKGFTIIEVVLVLAIAALIFLMVFIALPALQRGQRDTARKNDASVVASALQTFKSNNRGALRTGTPAHDLTVNDIKDYIEGLNQYTADASGLVVLGSVTSPTNITTSVSSDKLTIILGVKCPPAIPAPGTLRADYPRGNSRSVVVATALENNGSKEQVHCQG